jgi:acyl-CoA thioester hydrolase
MRIHIPTRLRWSDLDAYGHVNNAQMFGLLEEARIHAFWEGDNAAGDAPPTRIFQGGPTADTFTLIAHQEIEYLAPIAYQRDPLDLELWIGRRPGNKTCCYLIQGGRRCRQAKAGACALALMHHIARLA